MDNTEIQKYINIGLAAKFPYEIVDAENDVEISIGIENNTVYITFLGSATFTDWKHNFMFWKKPYKQMKNLFFVHAGFLKIYKIVRDRIKDFLVKKTDEYSTIVITGHSLGGAIATICYEDVMFMKETSIIKDVVVLSVTTGAPRVFSFLSSSVLKKRMADKINVVYKSDGVPTIPPVIFGYKHYGRTMQSGKKNPLWVLHPSFVYNHDRHGYKDFANIGIKETKENNYFYDKANKIYAIIYISLALIAGLVAVFLI